MVDTRYGIMGGSCLDDGSGSAGGTVTGDISIDGELPAGARPDLDVDGTIPIQRLNSVIYTGRPTVGQDNSVVGLFRLDPGGNSATCMQIRTARTSATEVDIIQRLRPGDGIVSSDISFPDNTFGDRCHPAPGYFCPISEKADAYI